MPCHGLSSRGVSCHNVLSASPNWRQPKPDQVGFRSALQLYGAGSVKAASRSPLNSAPVSPCGTPTRSRRSFPGKPSPPRRLGFSDGCVSFSHRRREQENAEGSEGSAFFNAHSSALLVLPSSPTQRKSSSSRAESLDGLQPAGVFWSRREKRRDRVWKPDLLKADNRQWRYFFVRATSCLQ